MRTVAARVLVLVLGMVGGAAQAAVLNVPSASYPTIQSAINAAAAGDTVLVANGTFVGTGNTNLDFLGKKITVRGSGGAANCIIDCQSVAGRRGVSFVSNEPAGTLFEGFTVRNGVMTSGSSTEGGGILIGTGRPVIKGCVIEGCTAVSGGGISCSSPGAVVIQCTIRLNLATLEGGGVYQPTGTLNMVSCTVESNQAKSTTSNVRGGGIKLGTFSGGGNFMLKASVVKNNRAESQSSAPYAVGGGLFAAAAQTKIDGCTFTGNVAMTPGSGIDGLGGGLAMGVGAGGTTVTGSTFIGNSATFGGGGIVTEPFSGGLGCFLTVYRCRLLSNSAQFGGGICLGSSTVITTTVNDSLLDSNAASIDGGGMYLTTSGTIASCTFASNTAAGKGGGLMSDSAISITRNTILWGNTAPSGSQVALGSGSGGSAKFDYCDILGSSAGIPGVGLSWGTGNVNANPKFLNPAGTDGVLGTLDDNFRLGAASPCVDAGSNTLLVTGTAQDLDNAGRRADDPAVIDTGVGPAPVVDMGAYERFGAFPFVRFIPWEGTGSPTAAGT